MLATRENGSATAGYKATTPSTLPPSQHSVKHLHVSSSISPAISEWRVELEETILKAVQADDTNPFIKTVSNGPVRGRSRESSEARSQKTFANGGAIQEEVLVSHVTTNGGYPVLKIAHQTLDVDVPLPTLRLLLSVTQPWTTLRMLQTQHMYLHQQTLPVISTNRGQ